MAPVIWGLDLKEMQWYKFGNDYMWRNKDFHLRRTKFIVYQCALIFLVVSESLGTDTLANYIDAQSYVKDRDPAAYMYNNDYVAVGSYNIFAGVFTATIFGAAFFFDLFWPERKESHAVRVAWKVCGVLACVFVAASAFALTCITALDCAYFRGVPQEYGQSLLAGFHKEGSSVPLCYRHYGRAIAAVVFVWPGFLATIGSCVLLFLSIDNVDHGPGPRSAHARARDAADAERQASAETAETEKEKDNDDLPIANPPPAASGTSAAPSNAAPMAA